MELIDGEKQRGPWTTEKCHFQGQASGRSSPDRDAQLKLRPGNAAQPLNPQPNCVPSFLHAAHVGWKSSSCCAQRSTLACRSGIISHCHPITNSAVQRSGTSYCTADCFKVTAQPEGSLSAACAGMPRIGRNQEVNVPLLSWCGRGIGILRMARR
jgi:hypothetical protein